MLHADVGDNLIVWMVDDPLIEEVNGGEPVKMADLFGRGGEAEGVGVNAVRVKMTGADGMMTYLNLDSEEGWQSWVELPGLEKRGGTWTEVWSAGPTFADISGYTATAGDASLSFMIEIGNYSNDGNWIVLAISESATLGELKSQGYVLASALDMQQDIEWTGGHYSIPEPTSGLLILVGGALLALRRKRCACGEDGSKRETDA